MWFISAGDLSSMGLPWLSLPGGANFKVLLLAAGLREQQQTLESVAAVMHLLETRVSHRGVQFRSLPGCRKQRRLVDFSD